ncbi:MAG: hypothetical protein KC516_03630, partial [Nanoarchaeota archaeon]|nr:hypothetical protein [Nanoarchaeota archaeon]
MKFRFQLLLLVIFILILNFSLVLAVHSTELDFYESERDNYTSPGVETTFYANYSSTEGFDLGQTTYKNPVDLGTGYAVVSFDPNGTGNRTAFVYSTADDVTAYYANGTELWTSSDNEFDYAYDIESGDFSGDGQDDIAFISSGGIFFVLNGSDGSILFRSEDYYGGYSIAKGDLDDDGLKNDFVLGVRDTEAGTSTTNNGIVALVYNGTSWEVNWTAIPDPGLVNSQPFELDISEVTGVNLVGYINYQRGGAAVYWANGTQRWKDTSDGGTSISVTFYDRDEDGEEDELAVGESGDLRYYDENGVESVKTGSFGNEYEIQKVDLDGNGIYDDILIGSNYHNLRAYHSNGTLAWDFTAPAISFESTYYSSYFTALRVADINNDSVDEIIVGGFSHRYYILNMSGEIIGKTYFGDDGNFNNNEYIGFTYGDSVGTTILNDTDGDGTAEIVISRPSGYFYVGQQVMCTLNLNGEEDLMYYNYTSKLWELSKRIQPSLFNLSSLENTTIQANITCEKGGHETQTSSMNLKISPKNSTLDIFDQENDAEDNAGWLSENVVEVNETTYFFANYTGSSNNESVRGMIMENLFQKDFGSFESYYHDMAPMDFNGDGVDDGFAYSGRDYIGAYYFNGTLAWETYNNDYEAGYILKSGDFNNDSIKELAIVSSYGYLIILDYLGNELYRSDDYYTSYIIETGDYNDDGIDEIVMSVRDINKGTATDYGIVAFAYDGSNWSEDWTSDSGDSNVWIDEIKISEVSGENLVGEINANGLDFAVYYGNGTKKFKTSDGLASYASTFDFVDYDLDGDKDEFVIGENGETYIYNEDGTQNQTYTPSTSISYEMYDIDYDDNPSTIEHVFFERYDIMLINSSGEEVWRYDLPDSLYGQMEVLDINDDGEEEIIYTGYEMGVLVLNKEGEEIYKLNILNDSMIGNSEILRMGLNYYGYGQGFEFAQDTESAQRLGYSIDASYVGEAEIYPRCVIEFDDGVSQRMSYNSSERLYYYERSFGSAQTYDYNITCESAEYLTRSLSGEIKINTEPTTVSYSSNPSTEENLDPNTEIVIVSNVSDVNNNLDTVILQYKNSTSDWNNLTMTNTTEKSFYTLYNSSFTPVTEGNYTYRIWANDSAGESSFSENTTLSVYWDCTWTATSDLGSTAGWDENKFVGNLTLNNTGDSEYSTGCSLDFRLNYNLAEGRVYFDGVYYKPSSVYSIPAGSNRNISINATFGTEVKEETLNVTITELEGETEEPTKHTIATIVSNQNGPYLYQAITSTPTSVYLTNGANFTLTSYLRNLMGSTAVNENLTAYNVSFNWTTPSGLTNYSGNISLEFENITDNNLHENDVVFGFSDLASMSPGIQTIYLYSRGYNLTGALILDADNNSILNDSINITFLCYEESDGIYVTACGSIDGDYVAPVSGETETGTGGGGGGGGSGGQKTESISSSRDLQLVRGEENEIKVPFFNSDINVSLTDLTFELSGTISKYTEIIPKELSELKPGENIELIIKINSPTYIEIGRQELTITIKGKKGIKNYIETKDLFLEIHELSYEKAIELLNESQELIIKLNEANLSWDYLDELYNESNYSLENFDYEKIRDNHKIIKDNVENALNSQSIIFELDDLIAKANEKGIETPDSSRLIKLAKMSLERHEFTKAYQRSKDAQLSYALETKGKIGELGYYLKNYPEQISLSALFLFIFSFGT